MAAFPSFSPLGRPLLLFRSMRCDQRLSEKPLLAKSLIFGHAGSTRATRRANETITLVLQPIKFTTFVCRELMADD